MPGIRHDEFMSALAASRVEKTSVFLIHGEEYLTANASARLIEFLLGDGSRALNVERLEGGDEIILDAVDRLNTYALLADRKIVVLPDARFLFGKEDADKLLEKAHRAHGNDEAGKGALHLMKYMSLAGIGYEDLAGEHRQSLAASKPALKLDGAWLDDLLTYGRQHDLSPASDGSPVERLAAAIEKGFPPRHYLIITAEAVDKRKKVFKQIAEAGTVVDCHVPKGDRRADRQEQTAVMREQMDALLKRHGKSMESAARTRLFERVGFDLRTCMGNMEKLVAFSGTRSAITADDVARVVTRTRREPIYELTNAVTDRDTIGAIAHLEAMLEDEALHPLQALAAISNQVRRLLVAREFMGSEHGKAWRADMSFPVFKQQVMPALDAYQKRLGEFVAELGTDPGKEGPPGRGTLKVPPEILPARNPKSPFPAFQTMKKASLFSLEDLVDAMAALERTDRDLKTQGVSAKLALEALILNICRK